MPIMAQTFENQIVFLAEMAANDRLEGAFIKNSFCSPHPSYKKWDFTLLSTTCWVNNSNVSRLLVLVRITHAQVSS